ncbi:protein NRT1/ PTR FAMILY 1.2-like [Vicia villosa]|uniref:protein NRT1/ PTR FAMILY 1.2-like n=1 Tax=Vicia villosa TaxID=3911 RepID=UPI00273C7AB3|nr:protein NRT1/ PTR FAMILY 1.2-like [Vicia villosa]
MMASLGPNMITYLMGSYRLHLGTATQILLLSSAANNFTPVVGAFIADSYLGRFLGVGLGSALSFLGITLLWFTAMFPQARPPACIHPTGDCKSATKGQMAVLLSAFGLMSIGNGGLSCSLAFGADQVNRKDNPNNNRVLEIFFSWYYAFMIIGMIIGLTGIVYIQDHLGWKIGFAVPAALMLLSTLLFFLASPLYVKITKRTTLFTGFAQVTVAAYKNRKFQLPSQNSPEFYHHNKDSDLLVPTDRLRYVTSRGGKEGWINDNINKGRFDKYYWVIVGLSALNLVYYLVCSWAYGPMVDTEENGSNDVNTLIDDKRSDAS